MSWYCRPGMAADHNSSLTLPPFLQVVMWSQEEGQSEVGSIGQPPSG